MLKSSPLLSSVLTSLVCSLQLVADTPVAESLAKMSFFNAQPSTRADYYIVLRSASWCSPCRKGMPLYAKLYRDMKASGKVELIFWSADKDQAAAQAFADAYRAAFPTTMDALPMGHVRTGGMIPRAYVLDKQGMLLYQGDGDVIKNWRYATLDYEKNKIAIKAHMKSLEPS